MATPSGSAWVRLLIGSDEASKTELSFKSPVALRIVELAVRVEGIIVRDLGSGFVLLTLRVTILHKGSLEPLTSVTTVLCHSGLRPANCSQESRICWYGTNEEIALKDVFVPKVLTALSTFSIRVPMLTRGLIISTAVAL